MWESARVLKKYSPTVIAVTGSVGKTSTKDAIFAMLSASSVKGSKLYVRKSDKSFNSEIGVPLTILGCKNGWHNPIVWISNIFHGLHLIFFKNEYPTCLVLEVGADHPGDIEYLTKWLKPDIAVITMVSKMPVHVEFFDSPAAVLHEKLFLARAVKVTGKLVLPANDPDVLAVRKSPDSKDARATTPNNAPMVPCLTFGVESAADVNATGIEIMYADAKNAGGKVPVGMSFKLNYLGNSVPATLRGVIGVQHVYALVAGAAAALAQGADMSSVVSAISTYQPPRGRMNLLEGINGSTLIDDTYNSSPDAVKQALAVLKSIAPKTVTSTGPDTMTEILLPIRKIAVLGDMMELGKFSAEEHRKIGELVADVLGDNLANVFVTVGIRSRDMARAAIAKGFPENSVHSFDTSDDAAAFMRFFVVAGDVILIKGSQSPRLERVSAALLADPTRAADLLVRQEPQWLARK